MQNGFLTEQEQYHQHNADAYTQHDGTANTLVGRFSIPLAKTQTEKRCTGIADEQG